MDKKDFSDYGAVNIIRMVAELHKRGYQRMRLCCSLSPSGCYLRTILTYKENVDSVTGCIVRDFFNFDEKAEEKIVLISSPWKEHDKADAVDLAEMFLSLFPAFCCNCHGSDSEYVYWFEKVVKLADEGKFPVTMDDNGYDCRQIGYIYCGKGTKLAFAPTGNYIHKEPYYRFYRGESTNPHSSHTIRRRIWEEEERFDKLHEVLSGDEWEVLFKTWGEKSSNERYCWSCKKEDLYFRFMDLNMSGKLIGTLKQCRYYKGEVENPYDYKDHMMQHYYWGCESVWAKLVTEDNRLVLDLLHQIADSTLANKFNLPITLLGLFAHLHYKETMPHEYHGLLSEVILSGKVDTTVTEDFIKDYLCAPVK